MTTPPATPPARPTLSLARTVLRVVVDALRGALIGLAELLPGISGGTIALITGVYERLIAAAAHVISAFTVVVRGPNRGAGFVREMRAVEWRLVVPVVVGMGAMVLTLAGPIEAIVSTNPELARGLFFGLVAASVFVPLLLISRVRRSVASRVAGASVFVVFALIAFVLTALSGSAASTEPSLWVVFFAAAIAVCALVVPGVSGSFFLLAIGLYSPTLVAVDERDLGYLGVFALGAIVGLATIVRLMKWLLAHHRRYTLLAMAGLMLGSLRALWPWQALPTGDSHGVGEPVAPYDPVAGPILFAVLGAAIVVVMLVVERILVQRHALRLEAPALSEDAARS